MLNSETRIPSRRFKANLFDVFDARPLWPSHQIISKLVDVNSRSFGYCFNCAVRAISHITQNLMFGRGTLRKESEANPLHVASNHKLSRHLCHRFVNHESCQSSCACLGRSLPTSL